MSLPKDIQHQVDRANEALDLLVELRAQRKRLDDERALKSAAFDVAWKAWEQDTSNSPSINLAMRQAWEVYERAQSAASGFSHEKIQAAFKDWAGKESLALNSLRNFAGLRPDPREE